MKKVLRIALLVLLVAAVCWFSIPRAALPSGESAAEVTVRRNHQTLSEGSYDAAALEEALRNSRCRPCFMESIPETVPEWEIRFYLRSGGYRDVYVYENITVLYTSRPRISYRILESDALLRVLNQSAVSVTVQSVYQGRVYEEAATDVQERVASAFSAVQSAFRSGSTEILELDGAELFFTFLLADGTTKTYSVGGEIVDLDTGKRCPLNAGQLQELQAIADSILDSSK